VYNNFIHHQYWQHRKHVMLMWRRYHGAQWRVSVQLRQRLWCLIVASGSQSGARQYSSAPSPRCLKQSPTGRRTVVVSPTRSIRHSLLLMLTVMMMMTETTMKICSVWWIVRLVYPSIASRLTKNMTTRSHLLFDCRYTTPTNDDIIIQVGQWETDTISHIHGT